MIDKKVFERDFIEVQAQLYPKVDPAKLEMTIYAFGLLEELIRCGLPLIFKGGTSLLLLLDNPQRVSTDIDIIVPPSYDFERVFEKVKKRFPFYEGEERGAFTNHYFRHFYFMFKGPISEKECRINLDVAFEENPYPSLVKREISLPFLSTLGEKTEVMLPSCESMLGDKLTAFAPTTIGVNPKQTSLGKPIDNRLQVMKQFYDIARLCDYAKDIKAVLLSYKKCHEFENTFRGSHYSLKDTLLDTFNHAAEIASMGLWNIKPGFYNDVAKPGIQGLSTNIFDGKYNQIKATEDASKIMELSACLLTEGKPSHKNMDYKTANLTRFKAVTDKTSFEKIRTSLNVLFDNKLL